MHLHDLEKIVALLSESKHSLDKAHEAARNAVEARKEVSYHNWTLAEDIALAKEEGLDPNTAPEVVRRRERLAETQAEYFKALETLTLYGKGLEDDLGSAGRVSDHFNGKKYPLGMSPL
jgi:hypothetical protein